MTSTIEPLRAVGALGGLLEPERERLVVAAPAGAIVFERDVTRRRVGGRPAASGGSVPTVFEAARGEETSHDRS